MEKIKLNCPHFLPESFVRGAVRGGCQIFERKACLLSAVWAVTAVNLTGSPVVEGRLDGLVFGLEAHQVAVLAILAPWDGWYGGLVGKDVDLGLGHLLQQHLQRQVLGVRHLQHFLTGYLYGIFIFMVMGLLAK